MTTTAIEHPTLCQLEYLTSDGWKVGHHCISLLHPGRYVERLTARNKFGRCTELDPVTQKPTGKVYVSPNLPKDLSALVPSPTKIPQLAPLCEFCDEHHEGVGTCLI